jgi:hypothetical protein
MLRQLLSMVLGTLLLIGTVVYAWAADARPADGTLSIDNQRFSALVLSVDGRVLGDLPPESRRDFPVPPGDHAVRVKTKQGRVVLAQGVVVRPNGAVHLLVAADQGKLTVRNLTGRDGRLVINGADRGTMLAGQTRVIALDPGPIGVQLRQGTMVLDSLRTDLRPGERESFTARAPTTADLRVRNPLPVRVRVRVDGRAAVELAPGEERTLRGQPAGSSQLVVTGPEGVVISREQVRIDPYDGGRFMVPVPSQGALRIVNLSTSTLEVIANGRRVATLTGLDNTLVELPLGEVELVLRDRARNVTIRTSVDVEPFQAITMRCDLPRSFVSQESRLVAEVEAFIEALRSLAS